MVSASIRTSSISLRASTVVSEFGFGNNITRRSKLPFGWQRYLCLDHNIPPGDDANSSHPQIRHALFLAYELEVRSTRLSFRLQIISVWISSLELNLWIAAFSLFALSIEKGNLQITRCLFVEAPQTSLHWTDWHLWKLTIAYQLRIHQLGKGISITVSCVGRSPFLNTSPSLIVLKLGTSCGQDVMCALLMRSMKLLQISLAKFFE